MMIRVLLVDDHPIVREGLRSLLKRESDISVVGESIDGKTAIVAATRLVPNVVVMDLSMAGLNGIEATRRIVDCVAGTRVLCLSVHAERPLVAGMLEAGASGYVLKEAAVQELVGAVRTVAAGQTYLSPAVAGAVVRDYVTLRAEARSEVEPHLTSREREVLQLIAEGYNTGDIAVRLSISPKTVGSHREHIMAKLELHSVAGLTKYAIREGLTTSGRGSVTNLRRLP